MRKVIDYKVVSATNVVTLQEYILNELPLGWYPIGGVAFDSHSFGSIACQAMVRYGDS